jgi:hypothetical protein
MIARRGGFFKKKMKEIRKGSLGAWDAWDEKMFHVEHRKDVTIEKEM